jgi:hypothetical protein
MTTAEETQALCNVVLESNIPIKSARGTFHSGLTRGCDCRCDCNGSHARYTPPPKLEGLPSGEAVKRILETKEWKGATVLLSQREVVIPMKGFKLGQKMARAVCECFILRLGSAELVLRVQDTDTDEIFS